MIIEYNIHDEELAPAQHVTIKLIVLGSFEVIVVFTESRIVTQVIKFRIIAKNPASLAVTNGVAKTTT